MQKGKAFISLGTNLGDRESNLTMAIALIRKNIGNPLKISSTYETQAWGNTNQPDFLNQVISVSTILEPIDCMRSLLYIEHNLGRTRQIKWEPRVIDLDLLYYDANVINTKELTLPHPSIGQRKFVLIPLVEIAPDFIHPAELKNQKQLLEECKDEQQVKLYLKTSHL